MSKSKVIFHRTKSVCDESIPNSWNDMAVVNAYDSAVSSNQRIKITFNDEAEEDDDTEIGEVVWKRKRVGEVPNTKAASSDDVNQKPKKKKKKKLSAKKRRWSVGDTCMAFFAGDERYYKAKIVELFNKRLVVQYEGYENEDVKVNYSQIFPEHLWNKTGGGGDEQANHNSSFTSQSRDDTTRQRYVKKRKSNRELYLYSPVDEDDHHHHHPPPDRHPPFMPPMDFIDSDLNHLKNQARDCGNLSKEALSSMLVSWYMAGYQTGYYRGLTSNN